MTEDIADPRVHFLSSLSPLIDELRASGIAPSLADVVRLSASIGVRQPVRDIVGARQYEARWSVLRRSPNFERLANALAIYISDAKTEAEVLHCTSTPVRAEYLELLANSGLLHLRDLKSKTGKALNILIPDLIQQELEINQATLKLFIESPNRPRTNIEQQGGE